MSIKVKNSYLYSAEPETIRAWRKHANPINQRIMLKWKNGEPSSRIATGVRDDRPKPGEHSASRELARNEFSNV